MKTPHKHAALIKAWADGATIERYRRCAGEWETVESPSFDNDSIYRVKPENIVRFFQVAQGVATTVFIRNSGKNNLRLEFHPKSGDLISAEKVKEND